MLSVRKTTFVLLLLLIAPFRHGIAQSASSIAQQRAAHAFDIARRSGPAALRQFLLEMPKGADLHNHLSGAVYAESWIRAAADDMLCVNPENLTFVKTEATIRSSPPQAVCSGTQVSAALLPRDTNLYNAVINAISMRNFMPTSGYSAHDHFFATFSRTNAVNPRHSGEWVDEVVRRASMQNELYVELMMTPDFRHAAVLAHELGFNPDLKAFRQQLLDKGLANELAGDEEEAALALRQRETLEHCGTPLADPACQVQVRFLYQVLREAPPEQVFAQLLLGFEVVSHSHQWIGINMVQPEDGYISMRDYGLHMQMVETLHQLYPTVHISLHAGELALGLVAPNGLRDHITLAVQKGHAERIGHGVDLPLEIHSAELLKEMAQKHIMVEINLTSNDLILGVRGNSHPLSLYRRAGVPVALSSDDEGVSRSDITNEYVKAVLDQGLSYFDLKEMSRTGLEHSFLPGPSLWAHPDNFTTMASGCILRSADVEKPTTTVCRDFYDSSERARVQWELERRFRHFESRW